MRALIYIVQHDQPQFIMTFINAAILLLTSISKIKFIIKFQFNELIEFSYWLS